LKATGNKKPIQAKRVWVSGGKAPPTGLAKPQAEQYHPCYLQKSYFPCFLDNCKGFSILEAVGGAVFALN